jgi:L-ribulose-5-phosphate 4-epimerase
MYGDIPCARRLSREEIERAYEEETGNVIVETFAERNLKPLEMPAVIISNHGAFAWGKDPADAVHNAVVLEEVAKMAMFTEQINPRARAADGFLLDKHYLRKHGANAYYGQSETK